MDFQIVHVFASSRFLPTPALMSLKGAGRQGWLPLDRASCVLISSLYATVKYQYCYWPPESSINHTLGYNAMHLHTQPITQYGIQQVFMHGQKVVLKM